MNELVTVAIPAYNHERFIVACLDSVRNQDYANLELVVVDDGSSDATPRLIGDYLATHGGRFARVVFKSRANRGVSYTSNECFACAQGDWVHLLGSDDLLKPDKVSRMMSALREWDDPAVALLFADADFIDATGQPVVKTVKEVFPPGPDHAAYHRLFLTNRVPNPTVAIRRDAFHALGGFDESLFLEDWDMWLRLSARYAIARVPEVLASYRYHAGNTHQREGEMLEACLRTFGKFLHEHPQLLPQEIIQRNWRKNLHRIARWSRRRKPGILPWVAFAAVRTLWSPADPDRYMYYADIIRNSRRNSKIS